MTVRELAKKLAAVKGKDKDVVAGNSAGTFALVVAVEISEDAVALVVDGGKPCRPGSSSP